jgi:1-deoxy-D-xylulose-5-phosphate reductoisomerase
MRRGAVCWYGDAMKSQTLRATPERSAPAFVDRTVTLLGATGSIGASTIDLIKRQRDRYRVEAVSAHRSAAALAALARDLGARFAAVGDPAAYAELKDALAGTGIEAGAGESALIEAAQRPADWVIGAITGAAGLGPTLAAAERGAIVALANKETLVCAGGLFMRRAAAAGATVLPVDSEHNALFQAMSGSRREDVRRVILTASGGPFRTASAQAIASATVEQALKHPNWSMGPKVTIDSATLMNKGLELIEAHVLFGLPPEKLDVVIHAQSLVHCLVAYADGSVLAHLSAPDMKTPISHALAWPQRMVSPARRLDFTEFSQLTFEKPDLQRFPSLQLARACLQAGGAAPTILNAANEVAVEQFLGRRIGFLGIARAVERTLSALSREVNGEAPATLDDVLALDGAARAKAREECELAAA